MTARDPRETYETFDDTTEPEASAEGEPTQLLRRLREERRLSDAAFETVTSTARSITAVLRRAGSQSKLRATTK